LEGLEDKLMQDFNELRESLSIASTENKHAITQLEQILNAVVDAQESTVGKFEDLTHALEQEGIQRREQETNFRSHVAVCEHDFKDRVESLRISLDAITQKYDVLQKDKAVSFLNEQVEAVCQDANRGMKEGKHAQDYAKKCTDELRAEVDEAASSVKKHLDTGGRIDELRTMMDQEKIARQVRDLGQKLEALSSESNGRSAWEQRVNEQIQEIVTKLKKLKELEVDTAKIRTQLDAIHNNVENERMLRAEDETNICCNVDELRREFQVEKENFSRVDDRVSEAMRLFDSRIDNIMDSTNRDEQRHSKALGVEAEGQRVAEADTVRRLEVFAHEIEEECGKREMRINGVRAQLGTEAYDDESDILHRSRIQDWHNARLESSPDDNVDNILLSLSPALTKKAFGNVQKVTVGRPQSCQSTTPSTMPLNLSIHRLHGMEDQQVLPSPSPLRNPTSLRNLRGHEPTSTTNHGTTSPAQQLSAVPPGTLGSLTNLALSSSAGSVLNYNHDMQVASIASSPRGNARTPGARPPATQIFQSSHYHQVPQALTPPCTKRLYNPMLTPQGVSTFQTALPVTGLCEYSVACRLKTSC